jgi:osmotically-inducible protein OsmY
MKRCGCELIGTSVIALLLVLGLSLRSSAQAPANNAAEATPTSVEAKDPPAAKADDPKANTDVPEAAPVPDRELQSQVQNALRKVPELSNDSLQVAALPDGLELTGNVASGRERQAAIRIAQSYARGRKVVDHIVVTGRNTPASEPSKMNPQANAQPYTTGSDRNKN